MFPHPYSPLRIARRTLRSLREAITRPNLKPRIRKTFSTSGSIAIAGIFSKHCGLQRAADLLYLEFKAQKFNVARIDITNLTGNKFDLSRNDTTSIESLRDAPPDSVIIHAPPPIAARLLNYLGQEVYDKTCMIGFWHWETPRAPQEWKAVAHMMDEIWAPTPFVRDALAATAPAMKPHLKIHANPVGANPFPITSPHARTNARAELGILHNDFVAGFTFAAGSGYHRKNPVYALDAFSIAFPKSIPGAKFLMRCNDLHTYPRGYKELLTRARSDPRIILLCGQKEFLSIENFYAAIDTLISLHRAEGFGLTIAEAVQTGAKAIVTDWELAPELRNKPGVRPVPSQLVPIIDPQGFYEAEPGLHWAEPDIAAAAAILSYDFKTLKKTAADTDR
jgi:hypothetical protein